MGIEKTLSSIERVIKFWQEQNIKIVPKPVAEVRSISKGKALHLPDDFIELYSRANGMKEFYPNHNDAKGFLFYPVEAIISAREEFGSEARLGKRKIFVFSDYLLKCWWYGCEVIGGGSYTIGILGSGDEFEPITNSLAEFLELYMANAPILYGQQED